MLWVSLVLNFATTNANSNHLLREEHVWAWLIWPGANSLCVIFSPAALRYYIVHYKIPTWKFSVEKMENYTFIRELSKLLLLAIKCQMGSPTLVIHIGIQSLGSVWWHRGNNPMIHLASVPAIKTCLKYYLAISTWQTFNTQEQQEGYMGR